MNHLFTCKVIYILIQSIIPGVMIALRFNQIQDYQDKYVTGTLIACK